MTTRRPVPVELFFECLEARALLAGDHPSLADLPAASFIPMVDNDAVGSSIGMIDGVIGTVGDDDLFAFVAPYSGRTAITVAQLHVGGLAPAIQLFDEAGQELSVLADGWDGVAAVPPFPLDFIEQGVLYYINVRAGTPSDTNEAEITGGYRVVIVMEIPAESNPAPGENEPVPLPIDDTTGEGSRFGFISGQSEVDQYIFATLVDGEAALTISTPGSNLHATMEVRDANGNTVAVGVGDEQSVSVAFSATAFAQYVVRIRSHPDAGAGAVNGAYLLDILADVPGAPEQPPTDQELTDAEIAGAVQIPVDLMSGSALTNDAIIDGADSDVFTFRALRTGTATVVIERPADSSFGAILDVFRNSTTRMAFDNAGAQAWVARVSFEVEEGADYYIRVRGRNGAIGNYTLKALSPLDEYVAMYPEGYSTGTIDEYVPLVNPNPFPVSYTLTARYEVGERDEVIATGVVPALSRGGVTITSQRTPGASLVRPDTPYALEVRSSGLLGATLSHYDFGVTTGENFTSRRSTVWSFAEARRDPDQYRDFLIFYNPNPSATSVRVSMIYDDGEVVSFTRTLDPFRRGGVNFTNDTAITRDGVFSVVVESDQPFVAALSSYDIVNQRGFGLLGDADAGSTRGAIPIFAGSPGSRPSLAVFNPSGTAATVTFTTALVGQTPPTVERQFVIAAGQRRTISSGELGLDLDVLAGLRYSSNVPVTVTGAEYHTGDGDATMSGADAVASSIVADAFVNPAGAGTTYQELLSVYNPWQTPTQVQVSLLREGGVLDTISVTVGAGGFSFIRVDQMAGVLGHDGPVAFSIRIDGAAPVTAAFMHYDLFLNGGWGTLATPMGMTTPLGAI